VNTPLLPKELEAQLWNRFRQQNDIDARAKLIDLYLPHARMLARILYARRFGNEIEFDDYHQLARIGLLEALEKFDPSRGLQFNTFAELRIRGAILNGLENQTEKHKQISVAKRLQSDRLEASELIATSQLGKGEVPDQKIFTVLADVGLSLALAWMLDETGCALDEENTAVELPFYRSLEIQQMSTILKSHVKNLSTSEQRVINYHYIQGISIEEIAAILSLSKGRISQIHRAALLNLKKSMRAHTLSDFIC
jgi:RNA polymerase sigma factor for flagellar operon FliA